MDREAWLREFARRYAAPIPLSARFWTKVERKGEGCWQWTGAINRNGYGSIIVGGKVKTASRVAYELAVGPIPAGAFVLHHCDKPLCVNPAHLYAGTHRDNMADKKNRGRTRGAVGERNTKAKVSDSVVREIRSSTAATKLLAARLGLHKSTIERIRSGRSWRHVE